MQWMSIIILGGLVMTRIMPFCLVFLSVFTGSPKENRKDVYRAFGLMHENAPDKVNLHFFYLTKH